MTSIKHDDFFKNYDLFAKLCDITSEPIRISKEGRPDLVVINADAFERRSKMVALREKLVKISEDSTFASKGITFDELGKCLDEVDTEFE